MYLHLGQDTVITTKSIIGIFDMDRCTVSKKNGKQKGQNREIRNFSVLPYFSKKQGP